MKKGPFFWLGMAAIIVVAFDIFANFGDWTELLWFCTVTTSLLAYSLFKKSALGLSVCLILAVPAQSPWVVDFLLEMAGFGMGRTAMLESCGPLIFWGSVIIHTFVIPVSFWGVWHLGFDRRSLGWAMLYGAALLAASYWMTPPYKNVNCVFFHCDANDPGGGYWQYFLTRSIFLWAMIVPVSYGVFRFVFRNKIVDSAVKGESINERTCLAPSEIPIN